MAWSSVQIATIIVKFGAADCGFGAFDDRIIGGCDLWEWYVFANNVARPHKHRCFHCVGEVTGTGSDAPAAAEAVGSCSIVIVDVGCMAGGSSRDRSYAKGSARMCKLEALSGECSSKHFV